MEARRTYSPGFQKAHYTKKPEKKTGTNGSERSKIKLTPKISAVLTGHGMMKAYLHRFHLSDEATCTCGNEYQTMDHILFQCANNSAQREVLKQQIGTWPASKEDLKTKHKKEFCAFIESIDFDNLKV